MRVRFRSLLLTVPVLLVPCLVPVPVLGPATAAAADPVVSDGRRARVWGEIAGGEATTSATYSGGGGAWRCESAEFDIDGAFVDAPVLDAFPLGTVFVAADPSRPTYGRYWVTCYGPDGARYDEIGWLQDVVDFDALARDFALRYLADELAPDIAVGVAPVGRTLVGTSTWFWIDGYRGGSLVTTHAVLGRTLVLRLGLDEVTWSFGDGTSRTYGPEGVGSPVVGEVVKRYRARSTSADVPDGSFDATVLLSFDISYTLDGRGPFTVTPGLTSGAGRAIVVHEAQALLR